MSKKAIVTFGGGSGGGIKQKSTDYFDTRIINVEEKNIGTPTKNNKQGNPTNSYFFNPLSDFEKRGTDTITHSVTIPAGGTAQVYSSIENINGTVDYVYPIAKGELENAKSFGVSDNVLTNSSPTSVHNLGNEKFMCLEYNQTTARVEFVIKQVTIDTNGTTQITEKSRTQLRYYDKDDATPSQRASFIKKLPNETDKYLCMFYSDRYNYSFVVVTHNPTNDAVTPYSITDFSNSENVGYVSKKPTFFNDEYFAIGHNADYLNLFKIDKTNNFSIAHKSQRYYDESGLGYYVEFHETEKANNIFVLGKNNKVYFYEVNPTNDAVTKKEVIQAEAGIIYLQKYNPATKEFTGVQGIGGSAGEVNLYKIVKGKIVKTKTLTAVSNMSYYSVEFLGNKTLVAETQGTSSVVKVFDENNLLEDKFKKTNNGGYYTISNVFKVGEHHFSYWLQGVNQDYTATFRLNPMFAIQDIEITNVEIQKNGGDIHFIITVQNNSQEEITSVNLNAMKVKFIVL